MKFYCHLCGFNTKRKFRLTDHLNNNHIITCELIEGLENQLFQVFNVISYALKNNVNYILPINNSNSLLKTYWNNFLKNLDIKNISNLNFNSYYEKKIHKYEKIPLLKKKTRICYNSLKLIGHFKSYRYFDEFKHNIFKKIKIDELKKSMKIKCNHLFEKENNISMHFSIRYDISLNITYYKNCLNHVIKKTNFNRFNIFYFCEEKDSNLVLLKIKKLKDNFENINFVKVSNMYEDWEQMLIMSLCDHNIIANTFSWWGAYFNTNKNKIICYPSGWFNLIENYIDFPSNFTKIKFKKKCVIFFNCHGISIKDQLLSSKLFKSKFDLEYIALYEYFKGFKYYKKNNLIFEHENSIKTCDLIIIQHIKKAHHKNGKRIIYIEHSYIKSLIKSDCRSIIIPHYTFSGYHYPYIIDDSTINENISKENLVKNINNILIDEKENIILHLNDQLEHVRKLDEYSSIKCYNFVKNNYRSKILFFSRSYPTYLFFHYLSQEILNLINVKDNIIPKWSQFALEKSEPIYPCVKKYLKLEFCNYFKLKCNLSEYLICCKKNNVNSLILSCENHYQSLLKIINSKKYR